MTINTYSAILKTMIEGHAEALFGNTDMEDEAKYQRALVDILYEVFEGSAATMAQVAGRFSERAGNPILTDTFYEAEAAACILESVTTDTSVRCMACDHDTLVPILAYSIPPKVWANQCAKCHALTMEVSASDLYVYGAVVLVDPEKVYEFLDTLKPYYQPQPMLP
jgi:hypothetical protein